MLVLDGTYTKMRTWSVHMLVYTSLVSILWWILFLFSFFVIDRVDRERVTREGYGHKTVPAGLRSSFSFILFYIFYLVPYFFNISK